MGPHSAVLYVCVRPWPYFYCMRTWMEEGLLQRKGF